MRYLNLLVVVFLFCCSEKKEKDSFYYFSNLQFTLDTINIDSDNEIIYLNNNLFGSDVTSNKKYFYNFNWNDHSLEKINLDDLRLEEKIQFEKEGPNGTGQFLGRITLHGEKQFTVENINRVELFFLGGKKLKTIPLDKFLIEPGINEHVLSSPILDEEAYRLYVLTDRIDRNNYTLGIFNLQNNEALRMPLNSLENPNSYIFTLKMGNASIIVNPKIRIEKFGTKMVISNQINSSFAILETSIDSLYSKTYKSHLTADSKKSNYKTEHESVEGMEEEYAKFLQDINFLPPFWDEKNELFYRFSYQEMEPQDNKDEDVKIKVYLTIFDNDLNLLGESYVPQLKTIKGDISYREFPKHFAKDGKIWIYENINDELAFVRLSIHKETPNK
jgi:hypothetical protein